MIVSQKNYFSSRQKATECQISVQTVQSLSGFSLTQPFPSTRLTLLSTDFQWGASTYTFGQPKLTLLKITMGVLIFIIIRK